MFERSIRLQTLVGALVLMACSSAVYADSSLRCGTHLVELGASPMAVETACGPPTSATTVPIVLRGKGPPIRLEQTTWIYDLGRSQFTRTLVFLGDLLQSIHVGNYGS